MKLYYYVETRTYVYTHAEKKNIKNNNNIILLYSVERKSPNHRVPSSSSSATGSLFFSALYIVEFLLRRPDRRRAVCVYEYIGLSVVSDHHRTPEDQT